MIQLKYARGNWLTLVLVTFLFTGISTHITAQEVSGCGDVTKGNEGVTRFGPFDYRAEKFVPFSVYHTRAELFDLVERRHYTPRTEALLMTGGMTPGGDLDYTLRVFPNHHRALATLLRLREKEKTEQPKGLGYSVECWFYRAIEYSSDDPIVRLLYAQYLIAAGRQPEVEKQLTAVQEFSPNNAFNYEISGRIYFEMKMYEKALGMAQKSYELGLTKSTLYEQLRKIGKWSEPVVAPMAAPNKAP